MDPRLNAQTPPMQDVHPVGPTGAAQAKPAPPVAVREPATAQNSSVSPAAPAVAAQPAPSAPQASQAPAIAQIVDSIPLRQPGQPQPAPRPQAPHAAGPAASQPDELETILQAVNNRVKAPAPPQPKKPKLKLAVPAPLAKLNQLKPKAPARPLGIMVAAVAVFIALAATAVVAYRQGAKKIVASQPSKVGTSYTAAQAIQAAGGLLVKPSDLDDYNQSLQSKLSTLNDSQDFNTQPLSDQMLGL